MKIAIASGKGGTGKTTLSTNLAAYLSRKHPVVLTDLDVEEPNSGLFLQSKLIHSQDMFKMVPDHKPDICTYCGLCQEVCNYNAILQLGKTFMFYPELCHSCYACSELCPAQARPMIPRKMGELKHYKANGFDFIESRIEVGQEQAVPLISQTQNYVKKHFNDKTIKLFDSPPGTSCPVIEATKDADLVILITEATPFGLHDLTLAVKTMREIKKQIVVVINKFGLGNNDILNYCNDNNIEIIAKIPNDRKIAELVSSGELIYEKIPEVMNELIAIESYLMKKIGEAVK